VTAAAFSGPLTMDGGSWVAVPRTADIPAGPAQDRRGQRERPAGQPVRRREPAGPHHDQPACPPWSAGPRTTWNVARSLLAICAVLLFLLAAAGPARGGAAARGPAGRRVGDAGRPGRHPAGSWSRLTASRPRRCAFSARRRAGWPASAWPGCSPGAGRPCSAGRPSGPPPRSARAPW
jgi:hypothetical protein